MIWKVSAGGSQLRFCLLSYLGVELDLKPFSHFAQGVYSIDDDDKFRLGLRFIILDWEHFFGGSGYREYFTWLTKNERRLRKNMSGLLFVVLDGRIADRGNEEDGPDSRARGDRFYQNRRSADQGNEKVDRDPGNISEFKGLQRRLDLKPFSHFAQGVYSIDDDDKFRLGLHFIILDWEHFFGGSGYREYFTWMTPRVQPQRKLREDASSQNHNQPNYFQNCLMLEHETKRETVTAPKTHVQPDSLNAQDIPEPAANISGGTLRGAIKDPIEEWIELLKGGVCRVHLRLGMIYLISGLKIQSCGEIRYCICVTIYKGQLHLLKNSLMLPIGIELLKGGVCSAHLVLGMIYLIYGLKIQLHLLKNSLMLPYRDRAAERRSL
nr:nucleotide-binding alpha-beta plait domain-containing protein [Tanacetum cinerariifolium]